MSALQRPRFEDPYEPMPRAWMGFVIPIGTVRICGWCSDKPKADAIARRHGFTVTHGVCVECYQRALAQIIPEPPPWDEATEETMRKSKEESRAGGPRP